MPSAAARRRAREIVARSLGDRRARKPGKPPARLAATRIVSGAMTMASLVPSFGSLAGRQVFDRTGLTGNYALTLKFAPPRSRGPSQEAASPDDLPDFFTALQEQLGLKLQPEKSLVPVFVIERLERPSEN